MKNFSGTLVFSFLYELWIYEYGPYFSYIKYCVLVTNILLQSYFKHLCSQITQTLYLMLIVIFFYEHEIRRVCIRFRGIVQTNCWKRATIIRLKLWNCFTRVLLYWIPLHYFRFRDLLLSIYFLTFVVFFIFSLCMFYNKHNFNGFYLQVMLWNIFGFYLKATCIHVRAWLSNTKTTARSTQMMRRICMICGRQVEFGRERKLTIEQFKRSTF